MSRTGACSFTSCWAARCSAFVVWPSRLACKVLDSAWRQGMGISASHRCRSFVDACKHGDTASSNKSQVTMMGPVTCCLLLVMFAMEAWHGVQDICFQTRAVSCSCRRCSPEVDVTLTKIEEIDSHFIAWSSSVLAAWPYYEAA